MARPREARLARLEAVVDDAAAEAARPRGRLRFYVSMCSTVREVALAAGIDIAAIPALRCGDEAAAELLALGDTPELSLADQAIFEKGRERWRAQHPGQLGACDRLEAWLLEVGRSYRDGETPGPSGSIIEWYAWALVQAEAPLSCLPPDLLGARANPAAATDARALGGR